MRGGEILFAPRRSTRSASPHCRRRILTCRRPGRHLSGPIPGGTRYGGWCIIAWAHRAIRRMAPYGALLKRIAESAAAPGDRKYPSRAGSASRDADQYRYLEFLDTPECSKWAKARERRLDAFLSGTCSSLGCMSYARAEISCLWLLESSSSSRAEVDVHSRSST